MANVPNGVFYVFACNFRGWVTTDSFLRGTGCVNPTSPNSARKYGDYSPHCIFVSEFGYLAAFANAGSSKSSDVLNDAKFRTF